jgi:hypothetical protein
MSIVTTIATDLALAADFRRVHTLDLAAALAPLNRIMAMGRVSVAEQIGAIRPLLPAPFLARAPIAPILPTEGMLDDDDSDA